MKKYLLLFIILSGCATTGNFHEVSVDKDFPHYEIQKIVVLPFEASRLDKENTKSGLSMSIVSRDARTVLPDIVARELAKWERYVVMNRRAFKDGLRLMNLKEKDVFQNENYLNLGSSLGVDAVIVGEVEKFGVSYRTMFSTSITPVIAEVSFLVKCIDVTTNETIWSFKVDGSSKDDDEGTIASKLVEKAVETLKTKIK